MECKYNENSGYVVYSAMGSFYLPTLVILYTYASIIYVVQTRNKEFKEVSKLGTKGLFTLPWNRFLKPFPPNLVTSV